MTALEGIELLNKETNMLRGDEEFENPIPKLKNTKVSSQSSNRSLEDKTHNVL
jgi:hypothetical protein